MQQNNDIYQMRFPLKLWHLINLRIEAIFWSCTGKTILLNFRLLNNYLQSDQSVFKTNNLSSFCRQLNLYGFRKVTSHLQDPLCNSNNPYICEYVHNCFQYGKPELLHEITRKGLNQKKSVIAKPIYMPISSLQKARRALQIALKKAAQDLALENTNKFYHRFYLQCEDSLKTYGSGVNKKSMKTYKEATNHFDELDNQVATNGIFETNIKYEEPFLYDPTEYNDELSKKDNEDLQTKFLYMPDDHTKSPVIELLAEYDADDEVDEGIITKSKKKNEHPLNCVLPFASNGENEDATMLKKNIANQSHLQGEWDLFSQQARLPSFDIFNGKLSP